MVEQYQHAVELQHIQMAFGRHVVHRDVCFAVEPGEVATILGPSGTGKTVLLKLMIGLLAPTRGKVITFGQDLSTLDDEGLSKLRARIGMLFQGAALFDSLDVFENIAYSLRERGEEDEQKIAAVVEEKLALIGLPGIQRKYPPQLSGGQKKRVGLARALASNPRVMLFDEPTTGLDPTSVRMIDDLIIRLRDEFGITSVVVTHDIASARRVSDRWILIAEGEIKASGPVEQVLAENALVRSFAEGAWREGNNNAV